MKSWVLFLLVVSSGGAMAQELLLFGGSGHNVFLGCLNCNEYASESICNEYGAGNDFRSESIFNEYGKFGNEYSSSSPWNEYTSSDSVPVVVDRQGRFYGYFTINSYRSDAVGFADDLEQIYKMAEGDLSVVRNILCESLN